MLKWYLKPGLLHYVIFILVLDTLVTEAFLDSFYVLNLPEFILHYISLHSFNLKLGSKPVIYI